MLGQIAQFEGNYSDAEASYSAALKNYEKLHYQYKIAHMKYRLACIAYFQRDFQQSIDYLEQLELQNITDNQLSVKIYLLFIENYLAFNEIKYAKFYFNRISEIIQQTTNVYVTNIARLAEALIWKAYPRMYQKVIAFNYLKELVINEQLEIELLLKAIYEYIDLLLLEYSIAPEPLVETEITLYMTKITKFAMKYRSPIISFRMLKINATYFLLLNKFTEFNEILEDMRELELPAKILKPVVEELKNQYTRKLKALANYETKNKVLFNRMKLESYREYLDEVSKVLANAKFNIAN